MAYKVIILYRLYMPSYFLGTFTEYPYLCLQQLPLKQNIGNTFVSNVGNILKIQLHKNERFLMTFIKIIRKRSFTIVHTSFLHNSPYLFPLDTPDDAATILQHTNK